MKVKRKVELSQRNDAKTAVGREKKIKRERNEEKKLCVGVEVKYNFPALVYT